MTFPLFVASSAKDTLPHARLLVPLLYLFVGGGVFHAPAEGLRASEAWWAGQAVVARVCVLTPVLSIVVEAGIRDFFALWKKQVCSCLENTVTRNDQGR